MVRMLVYDGDCGFCTSCAAWIKRRLPPGTRVVAEPGIEAAYWIDARGRRHRGHRAIARSLMATNNAGWRAIGRALRVPPISWFAALGYRVVAANRYRLPGATAACRTDVDANTRG